MVNLLKIKFNKVINKYVIIATTGIMIFSSGLCLFGEAIIRKYQGVEFFNLDTMVNISWDITMFYKTSLKSFEKYKNYLKILENGL